MIGSVVKVVEQYLMAARSNRPFNRDGGVVVVGSGLQQVLVLGKSQVATSLSLKLVGLVLNGAKRAKLANRILEKHEYKFIWQR